MNDPVRRPRSGERREQILDVALRLFAERGAGNVTTRQIATAVGISQPSLYAHFASADAIADELCVRAFETLHARFALTLADVDDPWTRIEMLGRAYIEFGLEHPDMYRIAFMPARADRCTPGARFDPASADPGMEAGLRAFSALRGPIVAICGCDEHQVGVIAQAIWAVVHGLTSLLIAKPDFPWVDRDILIDAAITMSLTYLASQRLVD